MKVKFVPQNLEVEIKPGQSVMHLAQDHNLYIKSVCKGVPSCAECRVRVVEGEHNVLPPASEELSLIGTGHFIDRRRLSCQLKCFGDVTIDLSEQLSKQQGLLGGRKTKKVVAKDDRVEEMVAIRKSEDITDEGEGVEIETPRHSEEPGETAELDRLQLPLDRQARGNGPSPRPQNQQRQVHSPQSPRPQNHPRPQPAQPGQTALPSQDRPSGPRPQPQNRAAGHPSIAPQTSADGGDGAQQERDPNRKRRRRRRGGGGGGNRGGGAPGGPPSGNPQS